jgi:predicted phage terminase large subunit-like protein
MNLRDKLYKAVSSLRRQTATDFAQFRKHYFEKNHQTVDGLFQKDLVKLLSGLSNRRNSRYAIAAPRGFAKSTIVSCEYVLFCICNKLEKFIIITSHTADQAKGHVRNIRRELETNLKLQADFSDVWSPNAKPGPIRWTDGEIITLNGVQVLALSKEQQIRGRRNLEARPSLIILDDVEPNQGYPNAESYNRMEEWLTRDVLKAGDSKTNVIFIGTIHHYNSLLARFIDPLQSFSWKKKKYQAVITFSENKELWGQWQRIYDKFEDWVGKLGPDAARRFYNANEEAMIKGTKVLWSGRYDYYNLMEMRLKEGESSFNSEMQNEPVNVRDCIFNIAGLRYWTDKYGTVEEFMRYMRERVLIFIGCDPSLGENADSGDYSAIVVIAFDPEKGVYYVLEVDVDRRRPSDTINRIIDYCKKYEVIKVGIEVNQFQALMADDLRRRADEENVRVSIVKVTNTSNKRMRIETLQPLFERERIRISRKHYALIEELQYFPKGKHDDALDALELAIRVANDNSYTGRIRCV